MSPHVLIGKYLDDSECRDRPVFYELLVERCIIDHFMSGDIDSDEFHYYCERFRRAVGRDVKQGARRSA